MGFSTHNRAGEITYTQTGPNTITITVTTYTKASSEADRPKIIVKWGDGKSEESDRDANYPQLYSNDIKINKYIKTHTYPSSGEFTLSFEDANRNADVVNIPNSIDIPFYIESKVTLNPFLGTNSSPTLLYAPIDDACLNNTFLHNPGAFDTEGDQLKYTLVSCKTTDGAAITGYSLPAGISMNANTGDLVWNTPTLIGEFNVAFMIEEYRNGYKIGSILRDMQITVLACPNNDPPVLNLPQEICVEAGDTVNLKIFAKDSNTGDSVVLSAVSGIFSMAAPKPIFVQPVAAIDSVSAIFKWMPDCNQVRTQPYTVLFKARDNGSPVNLFDLKTLSIKVIAPAPKNVSAIAAGTSVNLNWDAGYCNSIAGYKIYRKENSSSFTPDTCETGMPAGKGYSLIKTSTDTSTFFNDNSTILGKNYCYRIVAYFANGAESKVSQEICVELQKVVPAIVNVSVNTTSANNGSIFLKWMKAADLDVIQHPGPYSYRVYRSSGTLVASINNVNDTSVVDTLINTLVQQEYYVELWNEAPGNTYLIGTSAKATSPFLSISPLDKSLKLSWIANTPWTNDTAYIYKESAPGSGIFNEIDTTILGSYTDVNLVNGQTYCYKIQTSGKYSASNYPSPLLNYSQVVCAVPIDVVPPCAPKIVVNVDCENDENTIEWKKPGDSCAYDLEGYKLYFKDELSKPYSVLKILNGNDTVFVHDNLEFVAGCYLLTAFDTTGNESLQQGEMCLDNCPQYSLPNVFTPNGDNQNDLFKPFPYKHIDKIDMKIYDRWGRLVFKTNNPDVLWDGRFTENNQMCSPGTYYYICNVYEKKLAGSVKVELKGYLQIIY
ncbi:MAG: gliding motility-associated C-terminal domain-containing protein [Flavobacteriales bacterium]